MRQGVLAGAVIATAIALAGCGSGTPLSGPVRSATAVVGCLRAEHAGVMETPLPRSKPVIQRGLTTLITVDDSDELGVLIALYRDRADAARRFTATQANEAELLDGNTIVAPLGYPLTAESKVNGLEPCAFGKSAHPTRSAFYVAAYSDRLSGAQVVDQTGCLGCHMIGAEGNSGPGPDLSDIGAHLSTAQLAHALSDPLAPMPSFAGLEHSNPRAWRALISYLSRLRGHETG